MPLNFLTGAIGKGLSKGIGSALSGMVGGLFGKKKKTSNTINYAALRKAAEKGGFNPLTALRNGGGAGFMTTHHPTLGSRDFIGQAMSDGIASFFDHDPREDEKSQLETDIMKAQLHRIQSTNEYYDNMDVPTATAPNVQYSTPRLTQKDEEGRLGDWSRPEVGKTEVTNPWDWFYTSPTNKNAEMFEDRYGDGEILKAGLLVKTGLSDIHYNMKRGLGWLIDQTPWYDVTWDDRGRADIKWSQPKPTGIRPRTGRGGNQWRPPS